MSQAPLRVTQTGSGRRAGEGNGVEKVSVLTLLYLLQPQILGADLLCSSRRLKGSNVNTNGMRTLPLFFGEIGVGESGECGGRCLFSQPSSEGELRGEGALPAGRWTGLRAAKGRWPGPNR